MEGMKESKDDHFDQPQIDLDLKTRMEGLCEANEDRNFRGLDCCHNFMYYLEYLKFLLAE